MAVDVKTSNLYDVLQVSSGASPEVIQAAFRVAVKKAHPDVGGSSQEFQKLQEAYEVLTDPVSRREYDRSLARPASPPPTVTFSPDFDDDDLPPGYARRPDGSMYVPSWYKGTPGYAKPPPKVTPIASTPFLFYVAGIVVACCLLAFGVVVRVSSLSYLIANPDPGHQFLFWTYTDTPAWSFSVVTPALWLVGFVGVVAAGWWYRREQLGVARFEKVVLVSTVLLLAAFGEFILTSPRGLLAVLAVVVFELGCWAVSFLNYKYPSPKDTD